MSKLIFQDSPSVIFATNTFVNVPVILQFDNTPLISVVKEENLGFTTSIPIYDQNGTYLAKVNGTRVFRTAEGKNAGIEMRNPKGMTVCELNGRTLFEITHASGDSFRTQAELYTPEGFFVKYENKALPDKLIDTSGKPLQINGSTIGGNLIDGCRIGVLVESNGGVSIGCY